MLEGLSTMEIFKMFLPVIIVELALKMFCLVSIFKNGVKNLNKIAWTLVVLLISTLGPIVFLIFGRRNNYDD
ncbi:PLDc_N domain-containing protein [Clostridium sp. D2Q-14]|uniref:PLD nuclease N-terminal domain-containing protein n=1 Tax=Anaeromonas gelatinilytica TaxID=2683194 RepID=UPI00193BECA1|nr:PLD nuclease N-terminal domain-containing protein [Anaeromonas gelatinilytica]MBS4535332.1 PLDc_N domain-containing protein [Anaeromonas gelatinilytica]